MSLSCARSTGPAVLGLLAAILLPVLGFGVTRAGALPTASSGDPAPLALAGQSPWVTPTPPGSPRTFTLDLKPAGATPASDEVVATLYTVLKTRSAFEQTLKAAPAGTALDHTHPVALSAMPVSGGDRSLAVSVLPDPTASPAPAAGTPTLDLHCEGTGTCTGVYPVVVTLLRPLGGGRTAAVPHSTFTTYLTYSAVKSATPLGFTWVAPVAAPVSVTPGQGGDAPSVDPLPSAAAAALEGLAATLAARPTVPVTLDTSPQTLQALAADGPRGAQAVSRLAAMSTADPTTRQFLPETYVPVDLGALGGAGEGEEITAQSDLGTSVLRSLGVTTAAHSSTWVATATVGTALRPAMSRIGDDRLVLPDADLAPPRSVEGTWASAFALPLGRGAPVEAAPSDGELAQHFDADPSDPALEANQLLADLAMIHFEAPNTATPRAVVAVPPAGWVPSRTFDAELLAGLATDPVVRATTLSAYFSSFPAVTGASSPSRRLAAGGAGPVLPASLAHRLTTSRLRLTAFDAAVTGAPRVKTQLDELLLDAESSDLSTAGMAAGVRSFAQALGAQLSQVQLATQRTVTLTARTGLIPVTILSSAGFTVVGTLVLSGGRFVFPRGNTRRLTLDHPTNPTRIDIEARTSGD
ncbi:MAG: hypothetical protein ACLP62_15385, partial [Acidimicrobiales bacterium]